MKTVNLLYYGEQSLIELIENKTLNSNAPYLIRIYTAIASKEEAAAMAATVHSFFPRAQLVGASASGIIYRDEQYTDQTLILFDEYKTSQIDTAFFIWDNQTAEVTAMAVARFAHRTQAKLMHLLCSDHYYDVHTFIEAFNQFNGETKLVGGIAGDILSKNIPGYVFNETGILDHAILAASISGQGLFTYNEVNISHEPISEVYTLDQCSDSYWDIIDGIPASEWLMEQLGIEQQANYSDWQEIADNDEIIFFPMVLEGHHGASRFLKYDASEQRVSQYFSQIPEHTAFRIGYTSPISCVRRSYEICSDIEDFPIENLFVYSCLFRRLYLHNCAAWELSPFLGYQVCGAFFMGEISNINGTNEFLNGACCLVGTAENLVYIQPNRQIFDELNTMDDDKQNLLNFVLKKQSESVSRKNKFLLDELLKKQTLVEENLYFDSHVGIGNYLKYKEDSKQNKQDKLSMVHIENAEALKAHLGQDDYFTLLKRAINEIHTFILDSGYSNTLSSYILNDDTFFATVNNSISDTDFMSMIRVLFERFQFIHVEGMEEIIICRFVIVLHQEDMVERALNTLHANKHHQTAFLVCNQENSDYLSSREEFKIIGVLNRALDNDGVVPYFQGIYDNATHQINKYEALMRIIDFDGTVYPPAFFMDTAKKYHLYSYLSEKMFQKVFMLFGSRNNVVTLNFSAYDINSPEMQHLIFEHLKSLPDPSHFVLEILEDEQFKNIEVLREFVVNVRKYGVKIAIDDFGSGYSNFLELAEINPDYIKIDGAIVKNVHTCESNQKLLRTIVFLGNEFGIELVAEFVENAEIQACIIANKIQYSQGYHFSTPAAFETLGLNEY